ncbi:SPOR domain-containing protein [Lichenihabitans sp. Uapishka_5]|uniref:SPOR domain-containing protein n=1 Tax=Lichenihabitans sp. Uapishka_5 TaxID=3037302 RepID=UPI0029E7D5D3|nr:SPOR domain-containing protein [Lichenihabitans sp. Uapishka_5]MDX7949637.1 SPOR domain-containing protein [Lichenihabitans sp. Uapishka_5]
MSEPFMRPRQNMAGYDAQGQRPGSDREDPLAELARLVGKDDPFRSGGQAPASTVTRFPQLGMTPPAHPHDATPEYDDRDFDHGDPVDYHAEHTHQQAQPHGYAAGEGAEAFEPALGYPVAGGRGEAPPLNADLWAEGALPQAGPTGDLFHEPSRDLRHDGRGSRRTLVVLAAVVALTGGGLGATFLMRDGSGLHGSNGAPPTIMAAETPTKVPSPDVASGNAPDANTALLEKTGSDKVDNAKVVTNNEQPVDLNQLPKTASTDAAAGSTEATSAFPQPRKVKTVLIRPDGSVVGEAPQAAAAAPIGMVLPQAAGGAAPVSAEPKPSTPKSTGRASATPTSPVAGASGTKPAVAPTRAPKAAILASATPSAAADAPAAAPGTWSVQLGAPPSEQEAKDMSTRLQKKFAAELGGAKPAIVKADRDGKSIFRVRVGNLAQADAKTLCTKLQGSGGSCFVVRN